MPETLDIPLPPDFAASSTDLSGAMQAAAGANLLARLVIRPSPLPRRRS